MKAAVPNSLPGGWTPMGEGLYRGWDEVRSVSNGSQSGLRVIVLFTDGSANGVPGMWDGSGVAKSVSTSDFPKRLPDPDNITTDRPWIQGLYQTETGTRSPSYSQSTSHWTDTVTHSSMRYIPAMSNHQHHRSPGIPTAFPFQTASLTVDGTSQNVARGLMHFVSGSGYPAHVRNIRNAATNLVEIVADAARSDSGGDYPIRIYTIGMGALVKYLLGSRPESSESVLMRIANDKRSPDFNANQLEGKYYFALTGADVGPAFEQLRSQIVRLSK
jgi:hypothetical protein